MFKFENLIALTTLLLSLVVRLPGVSTLAAQTQDSVAVSRSIFATNVVDREPTDNIDTLSTDISKIFYFTELKNLNGKTIRHRWLHAGEEKAAVAFEVKGDLWRVHSSKNLIPGWVGDWTVEVVDEANTKLHEDSFVYLAGVSAKAATPSTAMADSASSDLTGEKPAPLEPVRSPDIPRAVFTTGIAEREPADNLDTLYTDVKTVYFFTELRNMSGKTVKHRWRHGGQVRAEVEFSVSGDRWRVHSSKKLVADWTGVWTAEVVGADGAVLASRSFSYLSKE